MIENVVRLMNAVQALKEDIDDLKKDVEEQRRMLEEISKRRPVGRPKKEK